MIAPDSVGNPTLAVIDAYGLSDTAHGPMYHLGHYLLRVMRGDVSKNKSRFWQLTQPLFEMGVPEEAIGMLIENHSRAAKHHGYWSPAE